jgi:hypothetical protein
MIKDKTPNARRLVARLLTPQERTSVGGGGYCEHIQSPDSPKFEQSCPRNFFEIAKLAD